MSPVVPFDVPLMVVVAGVNVGPTPVTSWTELSAGDVIVDVVMAACAGAATARASRTATVLRYDARGGRCESLLLPLVARRGAAPSRRYTR